MYLAMIIGSCLTLHCEPGLPVRADSYFPRGCHVGWVTCYPEAPPVDPSNDSVEVATFLGIVLDDGPSEAIGGGQTYNSTCIGLLLLGLFGVARSCRYNVHPLPCRAQVLDKSQFTIFQTSKSKWSVQENCTVPVYYYRFRQYLRALCIIQGCLDAMVGVV